MKRTIVFSVLTLGFLGFIMISKDAERGERTDDQNIIKFHFPNPQCYTGNWYGKVKSQSTGQIVGTCGPTTNCVCGPEGIPPGNYYVWGE